MNFNLISYLHRQREFSATTFGPGTREKGVVAHIRKELVEVEQAPHDVEEWVDVMILAMDGALRQGHDPKAVCDALEAKYAKNAGRTWPDWRNVGEDKPIEHEEPFEDDDPHPGHSKVTPESKHEFPPFKTVRADGQVSLADVVGEMPPLPSAQLPEIKRYKKKAR